MARLHAGAGVQAKATGASDNHGHGPQFPFSSPFSDDQSLRSQMSDNTPPLHAFSNSPSVVGRMSPDGDSDNTNGHYEFRLERYDQNTAKRRRGEGAGTGTYTVADVPRKVQRPGLNIITDLSSAAKRSHTHGVLVEQVSMRRPELARRAATSIMSARAEPSVTTPPRPYEPGPAFVDLADLTKLQKSTDRQYLRRQDFESQLHRRSKEKVVHRRRQSSPTNSSIVIGISVPEHEADAHRPAEDLDSALTLQTPATPAIIVTPAQDVSPWQSGWSHPRDGQRRPASSIYSTTASQYHLYPVTSNPPPVPQLPLNYTLQNNAAPGQRKQHTNPFRRRRNFDHLPSDEDADEPTETRRRFSSESQEQILPRSGDISRPKSQGWWNLMLSPMLSRAGTSKSKKLHRGSTVNVPIRSLTAEAISSPTVTQAKDLEEIIAKAENEDPSPDTPRCAGLATVQASTWSRWTEWENERDQSNMSAGNPNKPNEIYEKGHKAQESGATVPFMVAATPAGEGSAAEYFHACAIEQLSGIKYFECLNHSCAKKLPKLQSIHDPKEFPAEASSDAKPVEDELLHVVISSGKPSQRASRARGDSDSTIIDSEPEEFSPNVRQANTAAIMNAKSPKDTTAPSKAPKVEAEAHSLQTQSAGEQKPPTYSPPRIVPRMPSIAAVVPQEQPPIQSPGPVSPEAQRAIALGGAMPMSEVRHEPASVQPAQVFINNYTNCPEFQARTAAAPVTMLDIQSDVSERQKMQEQRQIPERENKTGHNAGGPRRGRGCIPKNGCLRRSGPQNRRQRLWAIAIGVIMLSIVIACIVLATTLTRRGDGTPVQSQWLNLTGFPPMPTGILTIARPDVVSFKPQCIQPNTLWSCAVPQEDQAAIAPNDPDQPNFRFEIRFKNGTVPANETIPLTSKRLSKSARRANDAFTNDLFTPSPGPPSLSEQRFMGNTTDNIVFPFEGEKTPFFITFIPASPVLPPAYNDIDAVATSNRLRTRQSNSTDLDTDIPPPKVDSDQTAAATNLIPSEPFPFSQPMRLYNRGQLDEHYGFYTYYDKSIFLSASIETLRNSTEDNEVEGNIGGSTKINAQARCTFSQTRFLVQMWTNSGFTGHLLPSSSQNTTANKNSAADFDPPGSFPYPTTITLDRHGGSRDDKMVYCYGMNDEQGIEDDQILGIPEFRGVGGTLVNAAPSIVVLPGQNNTFDPRAGGIDGGTGGCECKWQNWS